MEIRSIRAHPFGPVNDAELQLRSGLNVVVGANESGKSSWHGAATTALGGQRSGARRKTKGDPDISRHRPWNHDEWAVSCVLDLADGRRVRLVHNLARKRSQAVDDLTGADITDQLLADGGVDASTLVGLNRLTLPLVSSVGQAEILSLAAARAQDHPVAALRGLLQNAVSSRAHPDASADDAIARLVAFQKSHIGTERVNSKKPLRQALDEAQHARQLHDEAVGAWRNHRKTEADLEQARGEADRLRHRIAEMEHCQDRARLDRRRRELARARQLAEAADSKGPEPAPAALVRDVEKALGQLAACPAVPDPPARSAQELEAEIHAIAPAEAGDQQPHPSVTRGIASLEAATTGAARHHEESPPMVPAEPNHQIPAEELRRIAARLEQPLPAAEERTSLPAPALATCVLVVVASLIAGVVLRSLPLVGLGVVLGTLVGWAVLWLRRPQTPTEQFAEAAAGRRQDESLLMSAGLAVTPAAAQAEAERLEDRLRAAERCAAWTDTADRLQQEIERSSVGLAVALADRGVAGASSRDIATVAADYLDQCARRAELGRQAERRAELTREMEVAARTEKRIASAIAARNDSVKALAGLGALMGIDGAMGGDGSGAGDRGVSPAMAVAWLERNTKATEVSHDAEAAAGRLAELLGGRTLAELEAEVETVGAAVASSSTPTSDPAGATLQRPLAPKQIAARLRQLRTDLAAAETRANQLQGAQVHAEQNLVGLAESQERRERSQQAYERLQHLDAVVSTTIAVLTQARQDVHREVAPAIARMTNDRLARISAGRYKQIRVDPEDLNVTVELADGSWRPAEALSHGTAEQIYLLARLAIAETIAPDGESCPLLLDDVTVHADDDRTRAMLELLAELAGNRQVVLFSQETSVRSWAQEHGAHVVVLPPV